MATKTITLISIFLLFFINKSSAQIVTPSEGFTDCIVYKNGSVVYGKIINYVPTDTLRFQLANGQIMVCPPSIIRRVTMAKPKVDKINEPKIAKPYAFREHGLYGSAAFMMNFGRNKLARTTSTGVGVNASFGYLFRRQIGVGGGLGIDSYYLKDGDADVKSVFGEVRGYLSKRNTAEFFTLAVGYGQPKTNDNQTITDRSGGLLVQPTIGLRLGASARYNFFVELGARFQKVHYSYSDQWIKNEYSITYQRWILRGGILF
jgi:hypothetical protein